jgi:hypothetical protein
VHLDLRLRNMAAEDMVAVEAVPTAVASTAVASTAVVAVAAHITAEAAVGTTAEDRRELIAAARLVRIAAERRVEWRMEIVPTDAQACRENMAAREMAAHVRME